MKKFTSHPSRLGSWFLAHKLLALWPHSCYLVSKQLRFLSHLLALNTASRSKLIRPLFWPQLICCEHSIFHWHPRRRWISGAFFFLAVKMLSVLSIFQIPPSFAKEVVRILNAISLLYSLCAAQGHNYSHPECAYAIWVLFLLLALSNQLQLPQCRQNQRQLQYCLSSNCREQSLRRHAWGEQDGWPSVWLLRKWSTALMKEGSHWKWPAWPRVRLTKHLECPVPWEVGRKLAMGSYSLREVRRQLMRLNFPQGKKDLWSLLPVVFWCFGFFKKQQSCSSSFPTTTPNNTKPQFYWTLRETNVSTSLENTPEACGHPAFQRRLQACSPACLPSRAAGSMLQCRPAHCTSAPTQGPGRGSQLSRACR